MTAPRTSNNASKFILVLGTLASIIIVGGILYQAQNDSLVDQEILAIPEQTAVTATDEAMVPEASIPDSVSAVTEITEVAQSKPTLPSLDDSDPFVRTRVSLMSNKENLQGWLATDDLLRRTASYLDGLARGVILTKIFPLSPPQGKFTTHRDGNVIWLNAGNYERYNSTILILSSIDMKLMAQMFHFSRPLIERAFSELGYQPRQMDGIILTALEEILSAPVIVEPIRLTRESVAFKFADPELESLSPLQKQLVRSGPENTQRLQQQALLLKNALLNPAGDN
ncbi:MAG: hypothetical protein ACI8WL_000736 [Polaribacter sp.]|jgi:hypothetical protein|tara:strand:+ start:5491 stop:6339 length:849 start_codon:yes stop_codon:yes gene_type:complete